MCKITSFDGASTGTQSHKDKGNRKYKDSLFCKAFSSKEALLDLYESLHPEDKSCTEDDLELVTMNNVLVNDFYNDLSFTVRDKFVLLVEEQSSECRNMPLRFLIYVAHQYEQYLQQNGLKLHGISEIEIPAPEFYVISTKKLDYDEMRLSSIFKGYSDQLELKVSMIYDDTREKSSLTTYLRFVRKVTELVRERNSLEASISTAICYVDNDTAVGRFIHKEGLNMASLFDTKFDYDQMVEDLKISAKQYAEKLAEKRTKEMVEKRTKEIAERAEKRAEEIAAEKAAVALLRAGLDDNAIMKAVPELTIEKLNELRKTI